MKWLDGALKNWRESDVSDGKVKTRNVWFYPWKYHNKDNMDIHAVKLIEHLEAENKRLTELLNSKEKADTALISG